MHPGYFKHEHTEECNKIFDAYEECKKSLLNQFRNKCYPIKLKLWDCIGKEFEQKKIENRKKVVDVREIIRKQEEFDAKYGKFFTRTEQDEVEEESNNIEDLLNDLKKRGDEM